MSEIVPTLEKSEEQAALLRIVHDVVFSMDMKYLKAAAKELRDKSGRNDAMSVLNPSYDFDQSQLMMEQAKAIDLLDAYVTQIKKCSEWKQKVASNKIQKEEISKLFEL